MLEKDPVRGDVWQRQSKYAEDLKHLFLIIYSPKNRAAYRKFHGADKVTVVATDSLNRGTFILDALIKGWKICKKNNIDVLTAQDPFTTGLVGWLLKVCFKIPLNVQIHTDFFDNQYWIQGRLVNRLFNRLGKFVVRHADTIRAVGHYQKDKLINIGVDGKKVYVIPVNADLKKFANNTTPEIRSENVQKLGLGKFSKIIVATGRLKQEKDFPVLIRAMKKVCSAHPTAGLCILGEGSERDKITNEIQKLGLVDNVILPGAVSHEAVAQYLAVCDVYVMCSVFEGLPIALAEACASGKPVVSTAFAAAPELVVEGKTGFCVPIKGIDEMADRINYLLDNPEKAKTMGFAGRKYVLEMFNEEHNIRGVVKMWQETGRAFNGSK